MSALRRVSEEVVQAAEAMSEDAWARGAVAGSVAVLEWAEAEIQLRLAQAGKYDDTRGLSDLLVAVQDKIREVQSP